jgi:beta-glucosidase
VRPLFPFGFGLSYTTFNYANLEIRPSSGGREFQVSFDLTNTGARTGSEIAQVYVGQDHPSVPRPMQELKGFIRVSLQPGETRRVTVPLDARSFTWYDEKAAAWHADAGSYTVHVSRSSTDAQLEGKVTLNQAIVLPVN